MPLPEGDRQNAADQRPRRGGTRQAGPAQVATLCPKADVSFGAFRECCPLETENRLSKEFEIVKDPEVQGIKWHE